MDGLNFKPFYLFFLLYLFSCHKSQETANVTTVAPLIVEAKGHTIPKDSLLPPVVTVVDENLLNRIPAGYPTISTGINKVKPAGLPGITAVVTLAAITPGQDSFQLPRVIPAKGTTVRAGSPGVVLAKDPFTKDQNPQNFSIFGKLQGLKHINITSLLEDKSGNLWIGTLGGGITQYDGKYFTHYAEKEGLGGDAVCCMLSDKAGNLWVGTFKTGLTKFDGKHFTNFSTKEGLPVNGILSLCEDATGNIWIGTNGGGLCRYDGKNFTLFSTAKGIQNGIITALMTDKTGHVWFGNSKGEVFRSDGKSFQILGAREGIPPFGISSLLEDKSGNIWIASNGGGICKYDGEKITRYTTKEGLSSDMALNLYEDRDGTLWIATFTGGINSFDGKQFTSMNDQDGLIANKVNVIFEDKTRNLWIGVNGGLCKYGGRTFTHLKNKDGFRIINMTKNQGEHIWLASMGGGIIKYDGRNFAQYAVAGEMANNRIYAVHEDRSGRLWMGGGWGGILRFDRKHFTEFDTSLMKNNGGTMTIKEDKAGNTWFGLDGGGVVCYDGKKTTHFTARSGLPNNEVRCVLEDKSGNMWFGTNGAGICRYDGTTFTHFTEKEGLNGNIISCMMEDKAGNLWIGTWGKGIAKYDGKFFTSFTEKQGLPSDHINSVLEDKSGNIWFGSSFGLSKFSKSKLREFEDKNKAGTLSEMNVYFKNYTYEDGFLGIGCNTSAILEANDGKIWIGANDLLTVFHQPGEALQDTIPPDIQLQHIALFNQKIQWSDLEKNMDTTIVLGNGVKLNNFWFDAISKWYYLPMQLNLAYKNNFPTFNFIGITMNQPQKVRYQYKLEGFDPHWSGISSHTEAPYGNLPQGNYVFKVKAMNSMGYWSKEYNYAFTVRPPWWKTWWAYSFYGLFVSGIIYILFSRQRLQYRLNLETLESEKLKEVDQLKTRFFANISHEFRTPLTLILGQIDSLKTTIQEQRHLGQLDIADRNARRLLELINQLLDLSKLEARSMVLQATEKEVVSFLKSIFFSMQLLADKKQIQLFFESDSTTVPLYFDPDKLEKIYTNLLSNAWKFTPEGGAITTTISTESSDYITIGVSDTGAGIPEDSIPLLFDRFYQVDSSLTRRQQGTGIGLALVKELVDLHHGHIQVRSRIGEGSTFSIRLPVGRAHLSTAELMPAKEFISGEENWPTNWTGALEAQGAVISQFPEVNVEGNKRAQTTVLVVEDNPDVRAFIAESLRTMGNHHILQASNGREGLERAREVIPDLILTDVMMPEMDGITFSRLLRADELTSHIPVIMLTAKSGEEEKIEGLKTGIDDYLTKPFNARELLLRVNNLIKIRRELRRRFSSATVIRPAEVSSVSVDQIFLEKVIGIIEANIPNEQFGVEPLSNAVNMSVTHLNRKLNALIDQTAGHLIRSMRMQRAADLLLKNAGNVSEIAYMVGFSVPENFSRSFKQQFNCTPLEYQRNKLT